MKVLSKELSQVFKNRIEKRLRHLSRWARRTGVAAFRLYDRDVPGVPLTVDIYSLEGLSPFAVVYLHEKQSGDKSGKANKVCLKSIAGKSSDASMDSAVNKTDTSNKVEKSDKGCKGCTESKPLLSSKECEKEWKVLVASALAFPSSTTVIPIERIILKTRKRLTGATQYEKLNSANPIKTVTGTIIENSLRFKVNLTDYLDTGLFLDMRLQRALIKKEAAGKAVLNLFCYTGSFSVYSAAGGAKSVESVDLSQRYLEWAKLNMKANGFVGDNFMYTAGDCVALLEKWAKTRRRQFDLIILDPPTFSNSKRTPNILDTKRDHPKLIANALNLLKSGGTLYFSTNTRSFKIDEVAIKKLFRAPFTLTDTTHSTLDKDFDNSTHLAHKIFKLVI